MQAHIVDVWSESASVPTLTKPSWQSLGNCRGFTKLFFYAPRGRNSTKNANEAEQFCKQLCADCPVKDQCLAYALDNDEQYGIWGGLTPSQRNMVRR